MANSRQTITSLLTEHFRYTPLTLLDDIINTINELIYRAVSAVETGLTNAPAASLGFADRALAEQRIPDKDDDGSNLYPESRGEIEHGVHQLETLLEASVDKNFDKLEIFVLRSILNVPEDLAPWIRLGHYENLDFEAVNSNITPESLYLLRRKVYETRKLNNALRAERDRNARLLKELRSLLRAPADNAQPDASLAFLSPANNGGQFSVASKLSVSQVPALRQLLNELRPKVGAVTAPGSSAVAEERRDHIEAEVRIRLEKDGVSVQTGRDLLNRDSSAPAIGIEDIKGIEIVAGALENHGNGNEISEDDVMEQ